MLLRNLKNVHAFSAAALLAACALGGSPAAAQSGAFLDDDEARSNAANGGSLADGPRTMELHGVLRDFKQSHPDMQYENKSFGLRKGVVRDRLDKNGKPVLNTNKAASAMITSAGTFNQWFNPVEGVNREVEHSITLTERADRPGVYTFARERGMPSELEYFFPLTGDPRGWNDLYPTGNGERNFYFTYEIETEFTFTDPTLIERREMIFDFTGDDDVWVFINGRLAVDIGGVHAQEHGSVNIDQMKDELGLEYGNDYTLKLFFAERHQTASNFRIDTTISLRSEPTELGDSFD